MADSEEWDPEAGEFLEAVSPGEPSERDVWAAAGVLVKRHGGDAPVHAAMSADKFLAAGDLAGYRVWKRILRAVDELLTFSTAPGSKTH